MSLIFYDKVKDYKKPVESFRDPRIVGLQGIVDYIFSNGGEVKRPNTVDVTEFFRLNEEFSKSFQAAKVIRPALEHRIQKMPFEEEKILMKIAKDYETVLSGGEDKDLACILGDLSSEGYSSACSLLNGTYMDSDRNDFKDKRVVVTGSDTGIGRAVALEFARRGAKVALHYPSERFSRGALSAVDLIREYNGDAEAFQGDFREIEQVRFFADGAINYLQGVDILVNNAGITLNKAFEKVNPEEFDSIVNVNLRGMYFVTQRAVPYLRKSEGVVLNMASNHGIRGMAGHSVYAATKGAVIALSRELAMELSPEIRVNSINPGWVAGLNHFVLMPEADFNEIGKIETPYGIQRPDDFARSLVSLASDDFKEINAANVIIDRGLSAGMHLGRECTEVSKTPFGEKYIF